jgi:hypothetical protein
MAEDSEDFLDYHALIQDALRDVVREAMARVAAEGFPGEHHFYLSFRSGAEGVVVPAFLGERYPEEITIVLQNQFWDLVVDEEGFSVSLNFDASRERVGVPWEALTAFVDPAAEFALRFAAEDEEEAADGGAAEEDEGRGGGSAGSADASAEVVSIQRFKKRDD